MTPKSDFLLIGDETVTPKGSMNRLNFGITSLFVEQDYEQQTNTRLWFVRANKWFNRVSTKSGKSGKSGNLKIGQGISEKIRKFHWCQGKVREFY